MRRSTLLRRLVVGPPEAHLLESAARSLPVEEVFHRALEPMVLERFAPHLTTLSEQGRTWFQLIRGRVHGNSAAILAAQHRATPLLAALVQREIPVCLLKGAAQEASGHALPGRPRVDLDLLVPEDTLQDAEVLLQGLGYRLSTRFLTKEQYLRDHFHLPMVGPLGPVELHWSLTRRAPPGAMERMWARTAESSFAGLPVRVLAPGDQLLHHCLHISEHAFEGMLRWLGELSREWRRSSQQTLVEFSEEAAFWPDRSVGAPLWLLSRWGESCAEEDLAGWTPMRVPRTERALVSGILSASATGVWPRGVPRVVAQRSVARWLNSSDRWIHAALVEGGRAIQHRWDSRRTGDDRKPLSSG